MMLPSHVCRRWRDIALSTAVLWSDTFFDLRAEANMQREVGCARAWLSRSGQCPLSVSINTMPFEMSKTSVALELLVPECTRWHDVTFSPSPSEFGLLSQVRGNLPLLESLSLLHSIAPTSIIDAFEIAPKLRRLTLSRPYKIVQMRVPWHQLTHCDMTTHNISDTLHVLSTLAPNLVQLKTFLYTPVLPEPGRCPIVTHSRLSSLEMMSYHKTSNSYFLDHLTLPALRDLSVVWQTREVVSLLSCSACNLTKLDMFMRVSDAHNMMELLQHTPELQELFLSFGTMVQWMTVLEVLKLSPEVRLAPKLRSLSLTSPFGHGESDLDSADFVGVIDSRWRHRDAAVPPSPLAPKASVPVRIRSVRLQFLMRPNIDSMVLSHLRKFAEEGLDIKLIAGHHEESLLWS